MTELFHLRASAVPTALKCPGSLRATVPVDEAHEAATLGTVAHSLLEALPLTGEIPWDAIPEAAKRYQLPEHELRLLCSRGARLWREVADIFEGAKVEVPFDATIETLHLTGHADLLVVGEHVGRVGDWKTGRKDSDYSGQLKTYAALTMLDFPQLEEVTSTILWVRDCEIENYTMSRDDVGTWLEQLLASVVDWDGIFHTGSHCQYCPRSHECQAANALARRDVAAMSDAEIVQGAETSLATMTADEIVELNRQAKTVEAYAKRVRAAVKAHVLASGDVVGTDSRLTIGTTNRRSVDPAKARPVLEDAGFQQADFDECSKLSLTKVEAIVATAAGRGKGAKAKRRLAAQLEEADAIRTKATQTLDVKRA